MVTCRFYEAVQLEQRVMAVLEGRGQEEEVTRITERASEMLAAELVSDGDSSEGNSSSSTLIHRNQSLTSPNL